MPPEGLAERDVESSTIVPTKVLALEIVAPRQTTREAVALETTMAALAHACDRPVALEIAATETRRRFLARARDERTLSQLAQQLQARYPQARIRALPPDDDPLQRAPGETVTALELCPGAGSYLPLRTLGIRELAQEGADPLLGLLGACNAIPSGQRVVAQLALAPTPSAWSAPHQRMAIEHPLEPERARERWAMARLRLENSSDGGSSLSPPGVLGLLALVGLAILAWRNAQRFPLWLRQDVAAVLHQQPVHLRVEQGIWLGVWGGATLLTLFLALLLVAWLYGRLRAWLNRTPLYDQRLVQEKTMRVAYRARLRIFLVGASIPPAGQAPPGTAPLGAMPPMSGLTGDLTEGSLTALETDRCNAAGPQDQDVEGATETAEAVDKNEVSAAPAAVAAEARVDASAAVPAPSPERQERSLVLHAILPRMLGVRPSHVRRSVSRSKRGAPTVTREQRSQSDQGGLARQREQGRWGGCRDSWWRWRAWRQQRRQRKEVARDRRRILEGFIGAYRQFHLATGAYFTPRWLSERAAGCLIPMSLVSPVSLPGVPTTRTSEVLPAVASSVTPSAGSWHHLVVRLLSLFGLVGRDGWRRGLRRSPLVLSVADVAALWHLPQAADLDDLPFVEHTRARTLLAPSALTRPTTTGFRIGMTRHAGHIMPVYLPRDALRRNTLAIAKTGKGKSTLLQALAIAALAEELGLVLIDPHGDLAEAVLAFIPADRRDETLLVDLGDREYPIGLNLLDTTLFPDRDKAVANLIAVFAKIWKEFWGARMESALEAALKTLYEVNEAEVAADPQQGPDRQYTLLDVTPLLTYTTFRHGLLGRVRDPALLDFWMRFEALQPRFQQEIITPVTTKLDKFANSVVARRIVGQGRSTLDMAAAIRQGQALLVKTARGVVGDDIAAIIGATLLGLLRVIVAEQATLAADARKRLRVIVDEFQALPGVDFGAMLAELRKFGASFALATQALAYLDDLDRTLRATVMANVDQLFCYAMSAEDARRIEPELDGLITIRDLIGLDDFQCYARLTVQGQRVPVFSLALDPPAILHDAATRQREALRARSRQRIGNDAQAVETHLAHAAIRRKAIIALQRRRQQIQQPSASTDEANSGIGEGGENVENGEGAGEISDLPPPLPGRSSRRRGKHHSKRRGEIGFTAVVPDMDDDVVEREPLELLGQTTEVTEVTNPQVTPVVESVGEEGSHPPQAQQEARQAQQADERTSSQSMQGGESQD